MVRFARVVAPGAPHHITQDDAKRVPVLISAGKVLAKFGGRRAEMATGGPFCGFGSSSAYNRRAAGRA
jgi:hypothetical protein